jgi:hypothetical protein
MIIPRAIGKKMLNKADGSIISNIICYVVARFEKGINSVADMRQDCIKIIELC